MPDVIRTDSQRSDTSSLRPRVSFNRDVHVKRIVPREEKKQSAIVGVLNKGNENIIVTSPVRKERLKKTKKQLKEEAAKIVHQADKIDCVTTECGVTPEQFYTLPRRNKQKSTNFSSSLDRKSKLPSNIDELDTETPPKKPPRTFAKKKKKSISILDLFRKSDEPKKSNLRRSVSDASNSKSKSYINTESADKQKPKKQLSPIIEATQRDDYFSDLNDENNRNIENQEKSITDKIREYIDEIDNDLYKETIIRQDQKEPEVIIIDVDKAEKISNKKSSLKNKLKSIKIKKKSNDKPKRLEDEQKMIHSSQKPTEKPPLTKGRTVNTMVKMLNNDQPSPPPPKTNILITPNPSMQHNNNQPFSYTRGLSPDKYPSNDDNLTSTRPVIYAQVVCSNGAPKQTIHTEFRTKTQSDSDEGLGYDDLDYKRKFTHFGDTEEEPIMPKFQSTKSFFDSSYRGRGDGMDSVRRRDDDYGGGGMRNDLSARRDLLESRINRRLNEKMPSHSGIAEAAKYNNDSSSPFKYKYHQSFDVKKDEFDEIEPKSFDSQISDYRSSPETKYETTYKYIRQEKRDKNIYKSTPEIYRTYENKAQFEDSYHDSLKREKHEKKHITTKYIDQINERKEKFVDSGIENDFRKDSAENFKIHTKSYFIDSEDEGFASSLLIPNDNKHYDTKKIEEFKTIKEYHEEYVPRERSIDDGTYFDPRLDKEVCRTSTLKKLDSKPPKSEKKSGLDKVKQLFSRDKKKKAKGMVREESLRARYTEYKGSNENLEPKRREHEENANYSNRRRLSTPSSSPTRETKEKTEVTHSSWFKSLDRLSRKKNKKDEKDEIFTSTEEIITKPPQTKNLRFFGDTDLDSSDNNSNHPKSNMKYRDRTKSQSTRDLHNISEECPKITTNTLYKSEKHKSLTNIYTSKPPISPNHKPTLNRSRKSKETREESSTEGDSSQQSQRSVVYLHAATVGDIPGPGYLRNGRVNSREELGPQVKTLSRSFSVLAPWRPRHYSERDIDYSQPQRTSKYEQKVGKNSSSRKENVSTLKKKAQDTRRLNQSMSTLNRRSRSKENISDSSTKEDKRGSSSTLYKKKDRLPRENLRYNKEEKRMSAKSQSVESLRNHRKGRDEKHQRDVSRSMSMPKNPEKNAGWFRKK